jgi:predicted alpha/beta superfamily hydrolase
MRRIALAVALSLLAAGTLGANEPITIGERLDIQSKIMNEQRTILVSTPPNYEQSTQRYPVLYLTDGPAHVTHTRGTIDFLARNGLMPQVIIVGVANTDRTRDLSPSHVASVEQDGRVREFPTSGGASKFLDFFEQELFPYVDAHYRTVPYRVFSGHSFGGLFALNAFFSRPTMFGAVLSVGPNLQWDNDLALRQAADFFDDRAKLDATLVVAMANEEEGDPKPTRLDRLETEIENAATKGFDYQVLRMPDETHGSVVLRAHYWGLRKVFEPWLLPTDPDSGNFTGDVHDLKAHFAKLSKRVGYEIKPGEDVVNQAGYRHLFAGDIEGAISVFRYNAELYPDAPNVYDSLGEGLENAGQLSKALANYSKAVEIASRTGDERLPVFTQNRDRVQGELHKSKG